ncbi:MAG: GerMN domain-containing protein [Nocardioides sp.]|uniref:GerMN domain-containing protein n=1 Tax=Nocardioides sp. TaxID=35761 RepID=UPI0032651404
MRTTLARVSLALCAVLLSTACVRMPSSGPVTEVDTEASGTASTGTYDYDPQPPQVGDSPSEIVAGFLEAMKATPSRTSVASQFLTPGARQRWAPDEKIVTYAAFDDPVGDQLVTVPLLGIEEYDTRGAWQQSLEAAVVDFDLTLQDGQWRIDGLPDALIVPATWFETFFRRMSLYFFDPTAQILVPEPVFVPLGDGLASSLVGGLLDDPTSDPRITRTFVPPGFTYGTSVPITSAGIAEVSLVGDATAVTDEARQRIVAQLVWTMRQEDRIRAVHLAIGEEEQDLTGPATQVNLSVGEAFDPTGAQASADLFGLVDGLVVRGTIDSLSATSGPMGVERLGVRSIGVNLAGDRVAGISGDGRSVLVAPVEGDGRAVEIASGARNLLPPAWDFADRIWLADRARGGAVITVVAGEQAPREIFVPGVSGGDVRRLLVSRDGSRLVAVVHTPKGDRVVASRILHSEEGRVLRATRAVVLDFEPDAADAVVRDIDWRSPTAVSVLTVNSQELSRVETVSVDGAPGDLGIQGVSRLRGGARQLVSSPVEGVEVFAVARQSVSELTAPERPLDPLPEGLVSLTYVG